MRDGKPIYFTRKTVGRSLLWRKPLLKEHIPTNKYDEELPQVNFKIYIFHSFNIYF